MIEELETNIKNLKQEVLDARKQKAKLNLFTKEL